MTAALVDAAPGGQRSLVRQQLPAVRTLPPEELQWDATRVDLSRYLGIIARRRWLLLAIVLGSILVGAVATVLQTPLYRARAQVQVAREGPKVVDVQAVEQAETSDDAFLATQITLLRSRSLAARVAENLKLYRDNTFMDGAVTGNGKAALRRAKSRATSILASNLTVAPVAGSSVFEIQYEDADPVLAARIANSFATEFIGSALERKFNASTYARDFLRSRLGSTKARLERSERDLVRYAVAQRLVGVTDARTGQGAAGGTPQSLESADLASLDAARIQAQTARIKAEEDWRATASAGGNHPQILSSPTIVALRGARAQLQGEYQQKLGLFTAEFPEMQQLRARIAELDRQIVTEGGAIRRSIRTNYEAALRQERSLGGQVARLKSAVLDTQGRSIRYNILQREVDTNRQLYDGLLQRYKEIGVAGGVGASNISIVDNAEVPGSPAKPILWLNLAISIAAGVLLAMTITVGLELLDTSLKTPDDLEQELGLTLLGAIPMTQDAAFAAAGSKRWHDELGEAYLSTGSALQFVIPPGRALSLLLTSTRSGEGKSTSSAYLASAFAQAGKRVLLIDGDMRRPTLHRTFALQRSPGFSTLLSGHAQLSEVVQQTGIERLSAIVAGDLPPNAAQLLSLGALRDRLDDALGEFDVVLIDGPPVMGLADAPMMAAEVDATVLVVEAGGPGRRAIRRALSRLAHAHANLVGAVLTKFSAATAGYGYEEYAGYYSYGGPRELTDRRRQA